MEKSANMLHYRLRRLLRESNDPQEIREVMEQILQIERQAHRDSAEEGRLSVQEA